MAPERRHLVAGLGNPGDEYKNTRHNIGFITADWLAEEISATWQEDNEKGFEYAEGQIENINVVLVKPMNFMNRSGPPVFAVCKMLGIQQEDIIIIHDDMDLDFGRIKIKEKGGHGGHRGILSVADTFGDGNFVRLRMGIGHPAPGISVIDHVLGQFASNEADHLMPFIKSAGEAIATILCKGTMESMNVFNRRTLS